MIRPTESHIRPIHLAVVGASGLVGETFLDLLEKTNFPFQSLKLFSGNTSAGQTRTVKGKAYTLELLKDDSFNGVDLAFFSAGDDIAKTWAPIAANAGCIVVDNSAAFRSSAEHVLAVPEVNGHLLPKFDSQNRKGQIIANPNCTTIQLVVALNALKKFDLESVHIASYQAVSGAGREAQQELILHAQKLIDGVSRAELKAQYQPRVLALDCFPQIGSFNDQGLCTEEQKVRTETKKILELPQLKVSIMTVRVGSLNSHGEAVWVRLKKQVSEKEAREALSQQKGLILQPGQDYKTPAEAAGTDPVYVGRLHQDPEDPCVWQMWIVADNLLKGAALNGLQIAQRIFDIC